MSRKTPPSEVYPEWTEARVRSFIRAALRKGYSRWPPKFKVLEKARRTVTGKRHKYEYLCACCGGWFKNKDIQVDHIVPAGSTLLSWDNFINNLFCAEEDLQVLCKECHVKKTAEDKEKE